MSVGVEGLDPVHHDVVDRGRLRRRRGATEIANPGVQVAEGGQVIGLEILLEGIHFRAKDILLDLLTGQGLLGAGQGGH